MILQAVTRRQDGGAHFISHNDSTASTFQTWGFLGVKSRAQPHWVTGRGTSLGSTDLCCVKVRERGHNSTSHQPLSPCLSTWIYLRWHKVFSIVTPRFPDLDQASCMQRHSESVWLQHGWLRYEQKPGIHITVSCHPVGRHTDSLRGRRDRPCLLLPSLDGQVATTSTEGCDASLAPLLNSVYSPLLCYWSYTFYQQKLLAPPRRTAHCLTKSSPEWSLPGHGPCPHAGVDSVLTQARTVSSCRCGQCPHADACL